VTDVVCRRRSTTIVDSRAVVPVRLSAVTGDRVRPMTGVVSTSPCHARHLYQAKENQYWSGRVTVNAGNSKKLWRSMSSILLRDRNASLQPSPGVTADRLAQFFIDKVNGVCAATENAAPSTLTMHAG